MLNVRGDVYAEYSKFEKGEYFSWSCHLDYKQTMSRDSTNWICFIFFSNHDLSYTVGYLMHYIYVLS